MADQSVALESSLQNDNNENMVDTLEDDSDSLRSISPTFLPQVSITNAKKRDYEKVLKENLMRQNFLKNCNAVSPKKNLDDDSFEIESTYGDRPQKSFPTTPRTIRFGEVK